MECDFALKGPHVRVNAIASGCLLSKLTDTEEKEEDKKKLDLAPTPNTLRFTGRYGPLPYAEIHIKTKL